jgi:hypothetical protein
MEIYRVPDKERVLLLVKRHACKVQVVKPEGKRQTERPRRKLKDNIKMD